MGVYKAKTVEICSRKAGAHLRISQAQAMVRCRNAQFVMELRPTVALGSGSQCPEGMMGKNLLRC